MRQILLDTETTGLSPADGHRLVEVAAVELVNRRFTGNYWHRYINPERVVDAGAQKVHGLSTEFLKDKPVFSEVAKELFTYIDGCDVIIHNAPFDLSFLNHEFKLLKAGFPIIEKACSIIDTLVMARQLHRGKKNDLDSLCKRYEVDNSKRDWHGALIDAELLGWVYLAMTGGQISLFDHVDTNENGQNNTSNPIQQSSPTTISPQQLARSAEKITILRASLEEMDAHAAYMRDIEK